MSTDREITRIVQSWLEHGAAALPDRVLDAVLDQLPMTPQRRAWWPTRRFLEMNHALKTVIALAAVAVVAIVGINLAAISGGVGGTGSVQTTRPTRTSPPPASPMPTASTSDSIPRLPIGSLAPGTTYLVDDPCCVGSQQVLLTMPAGWEAIDTVWAFKNAPDGADFEPMIAVFTSLVGGLHDDPCRWRGSVVEPPVGPGVADLATALATQAGPGASPPTDVTIGGYPGKKIELVIPDGIDTATCDDGDYGRWFFGSDPTTRGPFTFVNGQHDTVYIVDVDGTRQVIDTMYLPGTPETDRAELDEIVTSIRFEPRPSDPPSTP